MAGGLGTYILQLWKKAAKGSVLLTDSMSIVAIPIVTVDYWVLEKFGFISSSVEIEVTELVSFVVLFSILGMILLRLLASPYLLWIDQNHIIAALNTRLAEPEMIERRWLAEYIAKSKAGLIKDIAIMIKLSMDEYLWREHNQHKDKEVFKSHISDRVTQYLDAQERAFFGINEMSHLPNVKKLGFDIINACDRLIVSYKEGEDPRPVKKEIYEFRDSLFPMLYNKSITLTADN